MMKLYIFILLITLAVFTVGGGFLFGVFEIEHQHEYGEWQTRTPATCTEDGVEFRVCECEAEETRAIVSLGHSYATTVTEPTCTEGGYTTYTCACGNSYTGDETAATGHSHTPVVTEPTCTEGGYTTYTCKCGDKQIGLETEALGHDFKNEVAEEKYLATNNCGEKATYYKSCHCGEAGEETFEYGDVLSHQYETVVTEPTCTDGGYTTYTCNCGHSYVSDETNAAGHSYDAVVTEPTCENGGYTTHTCKCGDSYVDTYTEAKGHNTIAKSDDTHHWTECANGCGQATDKIAHVVDKIAVGYSEADMMENFTLTANDFTVTATCTCGKEFAVTEGIEVIGDKLTLGYNTVTVKVGDVSMELTIYARPFSVTVNGTVKDDTYVYSDPAARGENYSDKAELSANGNGQFRVIFRYNFDKILNNQFYAEHKDEAKVQFVYTVTGGTVDETTALTFKLYPISELRSNADFSALTWDNYDTVYQFGWGKADGFVNKIAGDPDVTIFEDKIIITLTYREIEQYIDADGNLLAVFAIWSSKTKIGSIENEDAGVRPYVNVIFDNDHRHAFIEETVADKYLKSAKCGEQAKYYKSCSCGEAGEETFAYGEVIEHSYGQWIETQAPTCTDAAVETHTCDKCGKSETQVGRDAIGHDMISVHDEANHWTECKNGCGETTEKIAHFGGTATETEKAICEGCGNPYGGHASHVHSFSEWETYSPAGCEHDEVLIHYCDCGVSETSKGTDAFGHDIQTKYDETKHWTECVHNCGLSTEPVAHFGGEATESEKAVCEGCNQPYGEYKPAEKKEYSISGSIVDDTFVYSGNGWKTSDASGYDACRTYSNESRTYLRYNFSNIINDTDFIANKGNATVTFTFYVIPAGSLTYTNGTSTKTATAKSPTDSTVYNLVGYNPDTVPNTDVDFSNVNWTNVSGASSTNPGIYKELAFAAGESVVSGTVSESNISYENNILTLTVNYSDIENFIDDNGNALFVFATKTSGVWIASMESNNAPTVEVTYTK